MPVPIRGELADLIFRVRTEMGHESAEALTRAVQAACERAAREGAEHALEAAIGRVGFHAQASHRSALRLELDQAEAILRSMSVAPDDAATSDQS